MTLSITDGAYTIDADEEWAIAYLSLRALIADSDCWRALVADPTGIWSDIKTAANAGPSNEAAALAAVQIERFSSESSSMTTPNCLIRQSSEAVANQLGVNLYDIRGSFIVEFSLEVPTEYGSSVALATIDFANKISRIIRECQGTTTSERFIAGGIELIEANGQIDPADVNGKKVRSSTLIFRGWSSQ